MTKKEKAKLILEALDKFIQINWNFEEAYLKAIINGLDEIDSEELRRQMSEMRD